MSAERILKNSHFSLLTVVIGLLSMNKQAVIQGI